MTNIVQITKSNEEKIKKLEKKISKIQIKDHINETKVVSNGSNGSYKNYDEEFEKLKNTFKNIEQKINTYDELMDKYDNKLNDFKLNIEIQCDKLDKDLKFQSDYTKSQNDKLHSQIHNLEDTINNS